MVAVTSYNFPTKPPVHPDLPVRLLFLCFLTELKGPQYPGGAERLLALHQAEGGATQVRVAGPSATMLGPKWQTGDGSTTGGGGVGECPPCRLGRVNERGCWARGYFAALRAVPVTSLRAKSGG